MTATTPRTSPLPRQRSSSPFRVPEEGRAGNGASQGRTGSDDARAAQRAAQIAEWRICLAADIRHLTAYGIPLTEIAARTYDATGRRLGVSLRTIARHLEASGERDLARIVLAEDARLSRAANAEAISARKAARRRANPERERARERASRLRNRGRCAGRRVEPVIVPSRDRAA